MLKSTFQHIPGISDKKEKQFWKSGVNTWDDYAASAGEQLGLFGSLSDLFYRGIKAEEEGDTDFFFEYLKRSEWHRVAEHFHKDVLFLDIETTGLSLYYDSITMIGWSMGKKYGAYVSGQPSDQLKVELEKAKVVITFNGTLFDLKFIKQEFPDITLPKVHIDLRYLCKRVGLSGGQKVVEERIGFIRPDEISDITGLEATVLWHEYRRGNNKALEDLIIYNHQDVEGMKSIYDYAIKKYLDQNNTPKKVRSKVCFSNTTSKIQWYKRKPKELSPYKIYIEKTKNIAKPLTTFSDLNNIRDINGFKVLGIDLVSSEDRGSGVCVLEGCKATTVTLYTDEELIDIAIESGIHLVSIDSPLSIPEGRTSYFDDDPKRNEFGITRHCERILAKRGVKSYPCLIQSMQRLTKRGVELAKKFRAKGIPVIESYPGAAQDIMQIPRKQAGLKYLTSGLAEFGVIGDYTDNNVSHDELDAITSAIVGLFYQAEMFEALGNENEGYMYIPCLDNNQDPFKVDQVIAFSGPIASGKTTSSNILENSAYGFTRFTFSDILKSELKEEKTTVNRENLQAIGNKYRIQKKQELLGKKLIKTIGDNRLIAIDGIRFPEDIALFKETYGPKLKTIYISADSTLREERYKKRDRASSFTIADKDPVEASIKEVQKMSEFSIKNDGSLEKLEKHILEILRQH